MSDTYNMPDIGLFGKRCRIKNVHDIDDGFIYRIVNSGICSNCWKEPPLGRFGNENVIHDYYEDVVIVVCDTLIDEKSQLERVALKDIEIIQETPTLTEQEIVKPYFDKIKKLLKETYLEVANMDLDTKYLYDTQSMACSKFRNIMVDKLDNLLTD